MKKAPILMLVLFVAISFVFGCSQAINDQKSTIDREESEMKIQKTYELNVLPMSLRESLDHGAAVYICKVAIREPFPVPASDRNIERGKATLSVVRVLRGASRQTLILPYSFSSSGILKDGPLAWPPFNVADRLICVVVPDGTDPSTVPIPYVHEAACRVVNMDKDPTAVREIEDICAEYNAKDSKSEGRDGVRLPLVPSVG